MALVLKVSELDETDNIDCDRLCFGPWKTSCVDVCTKMKRAMQTSNTYPCIAAGFCPVVVDDLDVVCRFNWHPRSANFLRCSPSASCQRKFPAQCVTRDGIRAWRRYDRILKEHAQQMAHGLMARPVCGTPNAGPYCVHAPSGLGKVAELASWLLPMTFGTLSSIRAVETPGGDDDRQWVSLSSLGRVAAPTTDEPWAPA